MPTWRFKLTIQFTAAWAGAEVFELKLAQLLEESSVESGLLSRSKNDDGDPVYEYFVAGSLPAVGALVSNLEHEAARYSYTMLYQVGRQVFEPRAT
jgi:hypothetical protein